MTYLSNRLSYLRIGLMLVASCLLSEITLYRFPDLFHVGGSNTTETVENDSGRTAKSQQPCYRRCTNNFDNLIFLNKSTLLHQAGLEDRKAILRYTGQLAGYLCARLVVPSPRDLLTPNHNFRKPVSSTLTWNDDFVRIRFIQDQSLVLIQEDTNTQPNNKIELVCSVNNSTIHTTELHSTRNSVIKDFYKVRGIVQGRGNNSSICSSIFCGILICHSTPATVMRTSFVMKCIDCFMKKMTRMFQQYVQMLFLKCLYTYKNWPTRWST